jgi:AraC-like DNA-binding protein
VDDTDVRGHALDGGPIADVDRLAEIITRRSTGDGCNCSGPTELGVMFHRLVRCEHFIKNQALGPSLTIVARGRKRARFGDLELVYDSGRYIVITGETMYDAEILDAPPYLAATIVLPVDLIVKTQLALSSEPAADAETPPAFIGPFDAAMRSVVTRLFVAMDDPHERRIVAPLVREELVFRLLRSDAGAVVRSAVRARDAGSIHEAMRYIRERANRGRLSVTAIARHVAMSPSHFAHRFRAVAGVSPMRYLKQVRLDDARALMLGENLRVTELASRVGYESTSHFSRDFKLAFGLTPAAFARRIAGSGGSTAGRGIAGSSAHP